MARLNIHVLIIAAFAAGPAAGVDASEGAANEDFGQEEILEDEETAGGQAAPSAAAAPVIARNSGADSEQAAGDDGEAAAQRRRDLPKWARPATDVEESDGFAEDPEDGLGEEAERLRVESSRGVRRFHEVLDDLLLEFGYDVEQGQINGLKNLAVRQVNVNESLPPSYGNYLELLIAERIRENSNIRLLTCLACKTRVSSMVGGKLYITSPKTNVARLNEAADQLGIQHFLDATLIYHSTHMVLAFQVFDIRNKELVWARTYNSETIRSKFQRLAVDYSQVAQGRKSEEYVPEYKFLVGLSAAAIPNIGGTSEDSTFIGLQMRAMERFNRRRHEFGLMLNILSTTSSLIGTPAAEQESTEEEDPEAETEAASAEEETTKSFTTAVTLFAVYGFNFIGPVESYSEIRHGLHVGVGPLLAAGYYAPAGRFGWDVYFGRRWVVGLSAMYLGGSSVIVDGELVKTKGGAGGDAAISFNF